MKFPSLTSLKNQFVATWQRFPYALFLAFLTSISAIVFIEMKGESDPLINLIITGVIGFFLMIAIQLYNERRPKYAPVTNILGIVFLILYFLFLPSNYAMVSGYEVVVRTVLLGLSFVMAITFAPFLQKGEINGFWQHTKGLFVRLVLTFIFTGALYLGLVLAIFSVNELFGLRMGEEIFFELWTFVAGIISTTFFLSGLPDSVSALEKETTYPKGIKIFSQFILTPLFALYALILYAYTAKVLFTGEWPVRVISMLIIVFSLIGLVTYFLLYPLAEDRKNAWIKPFSKAIFVLIIPMTAMLFWTMKLRISDFGLTAPRYFVVLFGFWFLGISLYFLLSSKKNLKVMTGSVCVLTILVSFGPWGALGLSEINQTNRLEEVLVKNHLLVDGKLQKTSNELSDQDSELIFDTLYYLDRKHELASIRSWIPEDVDSSDCSYSCLMRDVMKVNNYRVQSDYHFGSPFGNELIDVSGYDYVDTSLDWYEDGVWEDDETKADFVEEKLILNHSTYGTIEFDLRPLLDELATLKTVGDYDHRNELSIDQAVLQNQRAKLILNRLNVFDLKNSEIRRVSSFSGVLLIKKN